MSKAQDKIMKLAATHATFGEPIRHHDVLGRGIPISAVEALVKKGLLKAVDQPEDGWVTMELNPGGMYGPQ